MALPITLTPQFVFINFLRTTIYFPGTTIYFHWYSFKGKNETDIRYCFLSFFVFISGFQVIQPFIELVICYCADRRLRTRYAILPYSMKALQTHLYFYEVIICLRRVLCFIEPKVENASIIVEKGRRTQLQKVRLSLLSNCCTFNQADFTAIYQSR